MKQLLVLVAMIALPFTSFATEKTNEKLKLINATELETMLNKSKSSTFVYDANSESTRSNDGVIPGAKLLTSSSSYDTNILPKDKSATLVFYCANQKCMASHDAARLALAAGYKNSIVMADGIQGWKKAGKPTEKLTKN